MTPQRLAISNASSIVLITPSALGRHSKRGACPLIMLTSQERIPPHATAGSRPSPSQMYCKHRREINGEHACCPVVACPALSSLSPVLTNCRSAFCLSTDFGFNRGVGQVGDFVKQKTTCSKTDDHRDGPLIEAQNSLAAHLLARPKAEPERDSRRLDLLSQIL